MVLGDLMKNKLARRLRDEGIELDSVALKRLERFADLLMEWNGTHNLTGARNIAAIHDNIVDALFPLTFVDTPASLLDVGTGAGFPGLVLAIAWPDVPVVLSEPLGKRAAFLKYTAMELELDQVEVARMRVESLVHAPFGLVTSRAVTDTKLLLDLTEDVADENTQYLFYKGSRVGDEMAALTKQPNYGIVQWNKRNFLWIK
jgi:16S rRNA (guanine527-N7)-methyltransferase